MVLLFSGGVDVASAAQALVLEAVSEVLRSTNFVEGAITLGERQMDGKMLQFSTTPAYGSYPMNLLIGGAVKAEQAEVVEARVLLERLGTASPMAHVLLLFVKRLLREQLPQEGRITGYAVLFLVLHHFGRIGLDGLGSVETELLDLLDYYATQFDYEGDFIACPGTGMAAASKRRFAWTSEGCRRLCIQDPVRLGQSCIRCPPRSS